MKDFYNQVRDEVAVKWYDLGVCLMIPHEQLDIIKSDTPFDAKMCCTKMFQTWLQVDPKANWSKLIAALKEIKANTLAEKIKNNILQGKS